MKLPCDLIVYLHLESVEAYYQDYTLPLSRAFLTALASSTLWRGYINNESNIFSIVSLVTPIDSIPPVLGRACNSIVTQAGEQLIYLRSTSQNQASEKVFN